MNLGQLRGEVLNHGFDPTLYTARINSYINDAQALIARRVDYYVDETIATLNTVSGTDTYAFPALFARMRSLFDLNRHLELQYAGLRSMDRSSATQGAPAYYAISGPNTRLWPIPDGVYNLEMRYWQMPLPLIADSDTPVLPADWHRLLWEYAVGICYRAEDDPAMYKEWAGTFAQSLSMFAADQKFPTSDGPNQAGGMWDPQPALGGNNSWTLYGG